jgi:transcriptional regulator with PAS, ATPase and Fis domain
MSNKPLRDLSEDVISLFLKYQWPGNVRELQSVIEYAVNFETGNTISLNFIEKRLKLNLEKNSTAVSPYTKTLDAALRDYEKEILENSIKRYSLLNTKEDIASGVCKDLNISRATLYRRLKDLGINLNREKNLKVEI